MNYPKEILLIRHGESEGDLLTLEEKAVSNINTKDYALTERGKKQSEITGNFIKEKYGKYDTYYVSYCKRTKETLEIIFPEANAYEDARVAEAQRGIWHNMPAEEIDKFFPYEKRRKEHEGLYYYRPFGGENWPDIEVRIHNFLDMLCREHAGEKVALIVHGHWLVLFQRIIHKFSIAEALYRYQNLPAKNASVTLYRTEEIDGKKQLSLKYNNLIPWHGRV